MKKRLSIFMLGLAVILTLVAVNINHHHHGEQMYIALQETCEAGTGNGQDEHEAQDENVDHTQRFMQATIVKLVPVDMADHQLHGFHCFFSFLPADIFAVSWAMVAPDNSIPKHPSTLYSSQVRLCRGLRAPPVC